MRQQVARLLRNFSSSDKTAEPSMTYRLRKSAWNRLTKEERTILRQQIQAALNSL